jgi:hypothetical protein
MLQVLAEIEALTQQIKSMNYVLKNKVGPKLNLTTGPSFNFDVYAASPTDTPRTPTPRSARSPLNNDSKAVKVALTLALGAIDGFEGSVTAASDALVPSSSSRHDNASGSRLGDIDDGSEPSEEDNRATPEDTPSRKSSGDVDDDCNVETKYTVNNHTGIGTGTINRETDYGDQYSM